YGRTSEASAVYTKTLSSSSTYSNEPSPSNPSLTRVELQCSEGGIIQANGKSFSVLFHVFMPEANRMNMALSFQVVNSVTMLPVLHYHLFDIETTSFRRKGVNQLQFTSNVFRLYKGNYFLRIYLAESKTKVEFERKDCCYFQVEMIGMDEIEWGWADDMCQYLDEGNWKIE
ncbi:MAG: hypothetical protein M3Y85_09015, partial [Bacteroidota bacterium]|nr:hypothetical protein [Bacteroidota bacterium]